RYQSGWELVQALEMYMPKREEPYPGFGEESSEETKNLDLGPAGSAVVDPSSASDSKPHIIEAPQSSTGGTGDLHGKAGEIILGADVLEEDEEDPSWSQQEVVEAPGSEAMGEVQDTPAGDVSSGQEQVVEDASASGLTGVHIPEPDTDREESLLGDYLTEKTTKPATVDEEDTERDKEEEPELLDEDVLEDDVEDEDRVAEPSRDEAAGEDQETLSEEIEDSSEPVSDAEELHPPPSESRTEAEPVLEEEEKIEREEKPLEEYFADKKEGVKAEVEVEEKEIVVTEEGARIRPKRFPLAIIIAASAAVTVIIIGLVIYFAVFSKGQVVVQVSPAEGTVAIDGNTSKRMSVLPSGTMVFKLKTGQHEVTVESPDGRIITRPVEVPARSTVQLDFLFAPPQPQGCVKIVFNPAARITDIESLTGEPVPAQLKTYVNSWTPLVVKGPSGTVILR
ncbi:hypothetical protein ACFLU6_15685, partial [Acidobacteriota bacterium]